MFLWGLIHAFLAERSISDLVFKRKLFIQFDLQRFK
jgi:hypothetical protein